MKLIIFILSLLVSLSTFATSTIVTCQHPTAENELNLSQLTLRSTDSTDPYSRYLEIELLYANGLSDVFKGKIHKDDLTDAINNEAIIMTSHYRIISSNPENPTLFVTFTIMDSKAGVAAQREVGELGIVDQGLSCVWGR